MSVDFDRRRFLKESATLGAAGFVSTGFPVLSAFATDNELGIAGLCAF